MTGASVIADSTEQVRVTRSFDADWRFLKGDAPGAETPEFNDAAWRKLDVPHDWSIEGPFDEKNPTKGAGGFLPSGIGWYRKQFALPAAYAQHRVFVEFDGVMANSDVWINGHHLGKRPYGYVSFRYDLTGHLDFGKPNLLAVRADNSGQPASRWYTGAGIYRHVRLIVTNPVHLEQWATFITTPQVIAKQATVRIESAVVNQASMPYGVHLQIVLVGPDGNIVQTIKEMPERVEAGKSVFFRQELAIKNPKLWDLEQPNLYHAVIRVRAGNTTLDDETIPFGIREAKFDAATGFWLNGKNFKIKGVCLHHDAGALGAAVPLRAWERRLERLRELGVNAIRTAHNPPSPEFLDLCDRMGFLVMDELFDCWTMGKNPFDYHLYFNDWATIDVRDTVRRDRNHPSIVLYSAGNEIRDTPKEDLAKRVLASLVNAFHEADPTRPVTQALFRPNVSHDYDNGLADLLDVVGTNYRDAELLAAHHAKPTRKIIGTEQGHDLKTWLAARDNPQHAGQFLWSGIDYLGESRNWPIIAAGSGLLDRTGTVKPMAYERQSWWSERAVVHIVRRIEPARSTAADPGFEPLTRRQSQFDDWSPKDTAAHDETIEAYSNCDEVELVLNGKSLGMKSRNADDSPRVWKVLYQSGTLKAVGKNKGKTVATHELRTAGKPAKILLTADRNTLTADWGDVTYITATVVDENGVIVPTANDLIAFGINGPGKIAAVDNGDSASHELFQAKERRAYQGRCVALIKAEAGRGRIMLTASASNLTNASIALEVK